MKIKAKWKVFAIGHFFSCETSPSESVRLFDELMKCKTLDDLGDLLRENEEAVLWEPFEDPDRHFPQTVEALARYAQEVEGWPDGASVDAEIEDEGPPKLGMLDGIDWTLLREQKEYCVNEANNNADAGHIYSGIVHLLDHLQDFAAETLGDAEVFGYTVEEEA